MGFYSVNVSGKFSFAITVEAENEEDARGIAMNEWRDADLSDPSTDIEYYDVYPTHVWED